MKTSSQPKVYGEEDIVPQKLMLMAVGATIMAAAFYIVNSRGWKAKQTSSGIYWAIHEGSQVRLAAGDGTPIATVNMNPELRSPGLLYHKELLAQAYPALAGEFKEPFVRHAQALLATTQQARPAWKIP